MPSDIVIRATKSWPIWNHNISLYAYRVGLATGPAKPPPDGAMVLVANPISFNPTPIGESPPPFAGLTPEHAQGLMDSLWDCGLRPSEGTGSSGALRSVERHLADMRRIAFKGLGLDDGLDSRP